MKLQRIWTDSSGGGGPVSAPRSLRRCLLALAIGAATWGVGHGVGVASQTSETSGSSSADVSYDPNGVLRIGHNIAKLGGLHFDPTRSQISSDVTWISLVLGTPMRPDDQGGYKPWLAQSVEIVDPSTITVTLREGIRFTDGAEYNAEALRDGMLRNLNEPASEAVRSGQNGLFRELSEIIVDGPLTLTFKLKSPVAGAFLGMFAERESAVPSPQALADGIDVDVAPVGAGPYMLDEHRPSELLRLRKNPDFKIGRAHV